MPRSEEIRQFASPPVILRAWSGWIKSWSKEPELFDKEDWSALQSFSAATSLPAINWQQVTGDAVNGYGLLEARPGMALRADNLADELHTELFVRSGKRLIPTPAASRLGEHAKDLVKRMEQIQQEFENELSKDVRPFHFATGVTTLIEIFPSPTVTAACQ